MQSNRFITFLFIGLLPYVEKSLSPSEPTSPSGAASHSIVPHPRLPTEAAARAQRRLCDKQCPAESRSAGCGARRKAVRLSGRRHGVAPWASVKLPLRPAFRPSRAFPSKVQQAQVCPEASRQNLRPRNPSKARVLPAYRHPWANRPVARWRRASFCRAARSSRRGPSPRGRGECATRGGTPRALA